MKRTLLIAVASVLVAGSVHAATYTIDPNHSSVSFRVKHIIGKVSGKFDKFSGTFNYDAQKPAAWSAAATIDPAGINTGIEKRDNHLRSADFFDVQKFPTMSFKTTSVSDVQGSKAKLHGELTMHGVTHPVTLDLEVAGATKDPQGTLRAGASATGKLNRLDFGVGTASAMIGNDIEITIDVEGAITNASK